MPTQSGDSTPISGSSLLIEWANTQDNWIRNLVAEVVATRRLLSDECIGQLYEIYLREKELTPGGAVQVEPLAVTAATAPSGTVIQLQSLKHIENVNALAPNQEIEFNPRITICFGENGSGKSGYVRIIKCAAAVRTAERILPNIHASGPVGTPKARIKVMVGGVEEVVDWQGEQQVEPLTRVDVFDSRAALVHLAEDLTYTYTPADLSLFPLIADGVERVQSKLQSAKEERQPKTNPILNRIPRDSRLYTKIEGLGSSTDLDELEQQAQISPEEEATLPGLREKVQALKSGLVREQITKTERLWQMLSQAHEIAINVVGFDRASYTEAVSKLQAARTNHEKATREALDGENVPGILGQPWRDFVEAAEGYIQEIHADPYPAAGQHCIYCRQPLSDAAVTLLRKYRDFCNDALRRTVEEALGHVQKLASSIKMLPVQETQHDINSLIQSEEDPEHPRHSLSIARSVLEYARVVQDALVHETDCPAIPENLLEAPTSLRAAAEAEERTLSDLRKRGEERERALSAEQARLRELEARLILRGEMPSVRRHVESARWADRANTFLGRFQGVKRGLTDISKRASNEVLNRDFQRQFEEECQALHTPHVSLNFPGRDGEARRRKMLTPNHGLEEILSEGEQKVIALADFLAEVSLKPGQSPVVFDDPVTSLDHKRLRHVVDRIVNIARDRQVIVFTHEIWFAAEILARFEHNRQECAFYDLTSEEGGRVGLVARGSSPRTDSYNDRKRRINDIIEQARTATGETLNALIERGYEQLRGCCEIVVETDLLKGVTERYRPNVRMTVLDQIQADRLPAAIAKVVPIFNSCCRLIASHSQPLVTLGTRPSLTELKRDWESLQAAREEYIR